MVKALQLYGLKAANSKPTYEVWEQLKNHSGLAGDTALADDSPYRFEAMECMRGEELGEAEGLIKTMLDFTQSHLPLNMNRYLTGFCLPKDDDVLKKLYVYLIGQGAMHSRLTLVKYNELIDVFDRAGLDLGVRRDAIQRSIETLDDDVRIYNKKRMKGARRLVDHVDAQVVKELLDEVTANYGQLKQGYKRQARDIMARVLSHSFSSAFYLSRSTYMARKLLMDMSSLKEDGSIIDGILKKPSNLFKKWDVGMFVANKKGDVISMMVASAHAIKTFTKDIKNIPRIRRSVTNRELAALRDKNGVDLDEFEQAFEKTQHRQLAGA